MICRLLYVVDYILYSVSSLVSLRVLGKTEHDTCSMVNHEAPIATGQQSASQAFSSRAEQQHSTQQRGPPQTQKALACKMAMSLLKRSGSSALSTDSPPFNPRTMMGNSPFRSSSSAFSSDSTLPEHALAHSNATPKNSFEYNG